MTTARHLAAIALVAALFAACSAVSLRTPAQEPQACMDALMGGTLAKHPQTGLGIADGSGVVMPVEWPFGYTARLELQRIALVDETGETVAREGDEIQVGGGMGPGPGPNAVWFACAPVTVTRAAK